MTRQQSKRRRAATAARWSWPRTRALRQEGFEGLRTRDVAADVGVNIGTLHYYFPSKEALIRAAVHHSTAQVRRHAVEQRDAGGTAPRPPRRHPPPAEDGPGAVGRLQ